VGSNDAMLTIWDLARMVCCRTLAQPQGAVKAISWSHDSEFIAYSDDERNCEIVKAETGG
jgi:WD40 repeat protein